MTPDVPFGARGFNAGRPVKPTAAPLPEQPVVAPSPILPTITRGGQRLILTDIASEIEGLYDESRLFDAIAAGAGDLTSAADVDLEDRLRAAGATDADIARLRELGGGR